MASQLRIDQVGLPEGVAGRSRTDGLSTGAVVTLTNTGSGSTTTFRLLWVPPGDVTAVPTLAPSGDPKIWSFEPEAERFGSYLIELIEDEGLVTELRERRVFAVRTPSRGLVIPALNERGDPRANLTYSGLEQIEAADNNATDFADAGLASLPYAAWWRNVHELTMAVDSVGGGRGFSNVFFVDKRNPVTQPTGSITAPFSSLQSAIDAIPPITDVGGYWPQGGVLIIAGNNYESESLLLSKPVKFMALGGPSNNVAGVVRIGDVDCQFNVLELQGIRVHGGMQNASSVAATDSSFYSPIAAGVLNCRRCELLGDIEVSNFHALECTIFGVIICDFLELDRVSHASWASWERDNSTVGTLHIIDQPGTMSPPEPFDVAVPLIATGATALVSVSVAGSLLDGIDVPEVVVATPTSDATSQMLLNARVSGPSTVRLSLMGPAAAGTYTFRLARVYLPY